MKPPDEPAGLPVSLGCDYAGAEPESEHNDQLVVESVLWYFRPEPADHRHGGEEGEEEEGQEEEEEEEEGEEGEVRAGLGDQAGEGDDGEVAKAATDIASDRLKKSKESKVGNSKEMRERRGIKITGGSYKLRHRDYTLAGKGQEKTTNVSDFKVCVNSECSEMCDEIFLRGKKKLMQSVN